jgi:predicted anti-sigma-YlaC factor YlaD
VNCEQVRESAAVALLTRSELDADVTEHLAGCELCRAELSRLAPLPALLGMLDARDLEAVPAADPQLLDRLLSAAARERRRGRHRVLAVAAAAILVLVVPLGFAVADSLNNNKPGITATVIDWHSADAANGVSGRAQVSKSSWGSDLSVSIAGVPAGTRCTVVVVTKDGQQQTAATWVASYQGTADVKGTVAAAWKSIARVDIVDETGKVLLHIQDA